ncbi:hypothetical protein Peur_026377 [Populus x canadensis]
MFDNLDLRNQLFTVNITIILNSSVPGAARRKMNRPEAKAGGFEALYRQAFNALTDPNDQLRKTFACNLSTTADPATGTPLSICCSCSFL